MVCVRIWMLLRIEEILEESLMDKFLIAHWQPSSEIIQESDEQGPDLAIFTNFSWKEGFCALANGGCAR